NHPIQGSRRGARPSVAGGLGFDMERLRSVMPKTVREKFGRQAPAWSASFRQPARRAARRMSAPHPTPRGGRLLPLLRSPVRVAYIACVALFLWCVAQFYHGDTGFSSL